MRITESKLRQIIREEIQLSESDAPWSTARRPEMRVTTSYCYNIPDGTEDGKWVDAMGNPVDPPATEIDPRTGHKVQADARPIMPVDYEIPEQELLDDADTGSTRSRAHLTGRALGARRMYARSTAHPTR